MGAICFSTKAILVKLAYRDTSVDPVSLLTLGMIFSLPFFLVSAFFFSNKQGNIRLTAKQWAGVALVGCLGYYISSLLDFLGLQYISAGIERLVLFIYPTLVLLMSSLFFREKITLTQWLAIAITYAGLLLAFLNESALQHRPEHFYWGTFLIFACAFTYAAYIVGSGKLIPLVGAAKFNSFAMTFAALGVLLHFFFTSDQSLIHLSWKIYGYSVLMAILSTVIPSYLIAEGIKRIGPDNTAIVSSVGPVSTILQANLLLSEPISTLQILGTVLILTGVLLISWRQKLNSSQ